MPHTSWDEIRAQVRNNMRAAYVSACVALLEDAHSIHFLRHEAHDAEARQRTAAKLVDTLVMPVVIRANERAVH